MDSRFDWRNIWPYGRKGMNMNERRIIKTETVGGNIRRLRLEHGETQVQLGEFLGFGDTTIANYESGYRLPDVVTFLRIMLHYEATAEDFLRE